MRYTRIEKAVGCSRTGSPLSVFYVLTFFLFAIACSKSGTPGQRAAADVNCDTITGENADDCIRLNQIQVLGTHNSYKLAPNPTLVNLLDKERPGWSENIVYEHRELREQLEDLGIRQFELDIFADPVGGKYAEPVGATMSGDEQFLNHKEMLTPGFKVFHSQDTDYRTTCLTFKSCLHEIREWSLANPTHLPILVLVEVKDGPRQDWSTVAFTTPVAVDQDNIHEIDSEIWDVFSRDHVLTPDDVRGEFPSLEEAVLTDGWPTLTQSRGHLLFALDNTGEHRDYYLAGSPDLKERAMFVSSNPGEPTAAFIKMNDAIKRFDQIKQFVSDGYVIRTRADLPLYEARTGDTKRREAALTSGAQYVSTDYPEPSPFGSGYVVSLPGTRHIGRCNPVSALATCRNEFLKE
ncbi:phosphatidylinositol-specific phospholipase C1-like protein [Aliifodinibius sp. S!AR15-10]|uniref:phosphatidylinositol-specific phospholipase C1-like protein n=1 Tax=Aliifodinibius sp. S!AR15-10 TaxID=2950437 RepID=UPI00286707CF|nr:phosphatidylinositol-specific phospholipase C1-like protein [Aliifodinibius sp. S!AR15-10]MDR8391729.1 phosphatidylinositol-specific phospholipase C1-like protein [Aliifodinibius sp. S!AR15-10]